MNVGLFPTRVAVKLVNAPLEMGMIITVYGLIISTIFVFELTIVFFSSDMSSFRKQLAPPLTRRSQAGTSQPSAPTLAPVSAPPPAPISAPPLAPRPQQGDVLVVGPLARQDKWKRPTEFEPMTAPPVNQKSLMAVSRGAAREA